MKWYLIISNSWAQSSVEQIVAGVGREKAGLVDSCEQTGQLLRFGTALPLSVRASRPCRDSRRGFRSSRLTVDDLLFPDQIRSPPTVSTSSSVAAQIGRECIANVLDGSLIDRVVGHVDLEGTERLDHRLQQLRDLRSRQRWVEACSVVTPCPQQLATCATSLSPRPLRQTSTVDPDCQVPADR